MFHQPAGAEFFPQAPVLDYPPRNLPRLRVGRGRANGRIEGACYASGVIPFLRGTDCLLSPIRRGIDMPALWFRLPKIDFSPRSVLLPALCVALAIGPANLVRAQQLQAIEEEPASLQLRTVPGAFDDPADSPLGTQSRPEEQFVPPTPLPRSPSTGNGTEPAPLGAPARDAPAGLPPMLSAPGSGLAFPHSAAPCGACDYWIVSSRCCNGANAPCQAENCLRFFHRSSDRCVEPVPREAFHAALSPDRPVCFVVHGSYNNWKDVLSESRNIHRWLRSAAPCGPTQFVFFTWPSNGNPLLFPVDIAVLGRRSSEHGVFLAQLVSHLPPGQPVCLMGHSHGARTVVSAMHLLGGGAIEGGRVAGLGPHLVRPLRAVLIAAAIDHDWFNPGERYDKALYPPERVLVMHNTRDGWLTIYPLRKVISDRSLGKGGLGQDDRIALDGLNSKVVELNAAEFTGIGHAWSHYYKRPELASALLPYAHFQDDQPTMMMPPEQLRPASPILPGTTSPNANGPAGTPAAATRGNVTQPVVSPTRKVPQAQPTYVRPIEKNPRAD
jgi:hypothetical protein